MIVIVVVMLMVINKVVTQALFSIVTMQMTVLLQLVLVAIVAGIDVLGC